MSKPDLCAESGCALAKSGAGFTEVEIGSRYDSTRLLLVGEASGESEARESLPFRPYAQSGSLLADAMRECNISRAEVAITNVLRCFPGDVVVEAAGVKKGFRRQYDGELVTVSTADGGSLPGTPNHPALTNAGWVALGELKEGMYLVRGTFGESTAGSDPNVNRNTPRFDEVFDAFSFLSVAGGVVGSDVDFHGDGSEAEVEVIAGDSFLWDWFEAATPEHIRKDVLEAAYLMGSRLIRQSAGFGSPFYLFLRQLASTNSGMGCFGNSPFTFWPKLIHAFQHGTTTIAEFDSMFEKYFAETGLPYMSFCGNSLQTLARQVSFTKITKIERSRFTGHVYNLHTDTEKYTANGFIVHNCRPPKDWLEGAPWQHNAISHCVTNYLINVIQDLKPRAILALGGTAYRALTSAPKGKYGTLDYCRGYVQRGAGAAEGVPVIASYHPAFLRRGAAHLTPLLQRDLRRSFLLSTGRLVEGKHYVVDIGKAGLRYLTEPSIDEAWEFANGIDPDLPLAFDIETPMSTRSDEDERTSFTDRDIKLFQCTQRRGEGIALPFRDEYVEAVRVILGTATRRVGFNNWNFDDPVLAANGIDVGVTEDAMVMYSTYWSDLPKNLQAAAQHCGFQFPWKSLSDTDLEFYGCCDVDATLCVFEHMTALLQKESI